MASSVPLEKLSLLIAQIEDLDHQKAGLMETRRHLLSEAKSEGFDLKVIQQVLKIRKMKPEEVDEQEELLHLYLQALSRVRS